MKKSELKAIIKEVILEAKEKTVSVKELKSISFLTKMIKYDEKDGGSLQLTGTLDVDDDGDVTRHGKERLASLMVSYLWNGMGLSRGVAQSSVDQLENGDYTDIKNTLFKKFSI